MSNSNEEVQLPETSNAQPRYNTRKRKLTEEGEEIPEVIIVKDIKDVVGRKDEVTTEKPEQKKLKINEEEEQNGETPSQTENGTAETDSTPEILEEEQKKIVTRSRKRKLSEEKKEDESPKAETSSRKRKEREEEVEVVVKKRRITRNDCICVPVEQEKPDYSKDKEAVITVADWRLHKVQSPIVLKHEDSNEYDHFEPMEFHGHWDNEGKASITNNGVTATLTFEDRETPILRGGPLHEDVYAFEQLHFHWSNDDHSGCEHIFEGKTYSMEAHAVHYNSKYGSFKDAVDKHDGLAVVAFFLQATDDFENECFNKLSEAVKDIVKINTSTEVRPDCLTWIKDGAQCKGYYTYQGSLTTEPYFESVTWIIYPKPIHISREQVQNFRDMKSTPCEKHNILNNVRPVQTPQKKLDIIYARSHRITGEVA